MKVGDTVMVDGHLAVIKDQPEADPGLIRVRFLKSLTEKWIMTEQVDRVVID